MYNFQSVLTTNICWMPENYICPIFGFLKISPYRNMTSGLVVGLKRKHVWMGLLKSLLIYNLSKADEIQLPIEMKMLKGNLFYLKWKRQLKMSCKEFSPDCLISVSGRTSFQKKWQIFTFSGTFLCFIPFRIEAI